MEINYFITPKTTPAFGYLTLQLLDYSRINAAH